MKIKSLCEEALIYIILYGGAALIVPSLYLLSWLIGKKDVE